VAEEGRLARNTFANILQTIVGAGLLFALYRYINISLGVEQLGVWSVVLATASASRLADLGLGAGVTRFVARDRARGELERAGQVIDTATLTLMVSVGTVLPLLYPLLVKLLLHLFETTHLVQALAILPYALISLWLTIVAAVFQGGLDGCQRMELRAGLVIAGQALLLALAFWLVPRYGLEGLAWAQIGQGLFLVVTGRSMLQRTLPRLHYLPKYWRRHVLREMLGYGINVQVANIFSLLLDPVANALMARFGGPAAAGYFTMANQVVLKARSVLVFANQAVVPHVASQSGDEPKQLNQFYRENMGALAFIVLPSFTLLFSWAGGFSWVLTGTYTPEFVFLLGLLALAWGINVLSSPAYFSNMGTGKVGWNTLAHTIMGVLNAVLGWVLGNIYGTNGVAVAYALALIIASGVLIAVFHRKNSPGWPEGIAREYLGLIAICVGIVVFYRIEPLQPSTAGAIAILAGLALSPILLGLAMWFHPMRRRLLNRLISRRIRP